MRRRSGTLTKLQFIDASRAGLWLARLTSPWVRTEIQELQFELIEVRDDAGDLIEERLRFVDFFEVLDAIERSRVWESLTQDIPVGSTLRTYLTKSAVIAVRRKLLLVLIAAWKARQIDAACVVLFLEKQPWLFALHQYAARNGVELVDVYPSMSWRNLTTSSTISGDWRQRTHEKYFLSPESIEFIRQLYYRALHFWIGLKRSSHVAGNVATLGHDENSGSRLNPGSRFKVTLDARGPLRLEHPELNSDLFFVQRSELNPSDTLILIKSQVNSEVLGHLRSEGVSTLALHPDAADEPRVNLYVGADIQRKVFPKNRASQEPEGRWVEELKTKYSVQRRYWSNLFEATKTRVYCTWWRFDGEQAVIAAGMREAGGVVAVYPRAFNPMATPLTAVNADVAFAYGSESYGVEERSGSRIQYDIVVGYIGDHRFELLRPEAERVRQNILRNGATRILAYFDENSIDGSRWHTGHDFMRTNYQFVLERVLQEPWFGLIIKPKAPATLRRRLGPIAELVTAAERTGRCHVYDMGSDTGDYPPAVAALSADVAVHGHLVAATAGLESALVGVPTLLLDREGWSRSPLYELGPSVVFGDWMDLWTMVREHWGKASVPGFGNWSPLLERLDPFRDGRAAERMGTFIHWLLEGFNRGQEREEALAGAAARYGDLWGDDYVRPVGLKSVRAESAAVHGQ